MEKEKSGKEQFFGRDEYEKRAELIKKLTQELNKDLGLEGDDMIRFTPDYFIVPLTYKDKKRVEHHIMTQMSSRKKKLDSFYALEKEQHEKKVTPRSITSRHMIKCSIILTSLFRSDQQKELNSVLGEALREVDQIEEKRKEEGIEKEEVDKEIEEFYKRLSKEA